MSKRALARSSVRMTVDDPYDEPADGEVRGCFSGDQAEAGESPGRYVKPESFAGEPDRARCYQECRAP
jgi:hypothetical protein